MLQWANPFTWKEYVWIAIFIVATLLHIGRYFRVVRAFPNQDKRLIFIKLALRAFYFSLFIIALLGPSLGVGKKNIKIVGKDIYIAVDLSQSMNVEDVPPSRLLKAKHELCKLIQQLPTDKIGLIIFSTQAFLQCPLTLDKAVIKLFLENLKTDLLPEGTTNFVAPLQLAYQKIRHTHENLTNHNSKSKIVILVSDGEDFSDNLGDILEQYQRAGIRIFCLGVGTSKGGKIPTAHGFAKDKYGREAISQLNTRILNELAQKTGGNFFEISSEKNELPLLLQAIQQIAGEQFDNKTVDVSYNKYIYVLWMAFLLICIDILVNINVINFSPQS
ncbi:MAG: VWA domain-containing protein [Microscillaceae bacterium]|nr:VWA domain-containing protein [Microscillaceae bacterium]MDW8461398.1 VWA domain-containing protein [Cytophagales bacterium]